MKNKNLIKLLQEYPENAEVLISGIDVDRCGGWESYCVKNIKIEFDKKYNELLIEGDLE